MSLSTSSRLLVLAVLCVACLLSGAPLQAGDAVTLQLRWVHGCQFAGYYMAEEQGLYAAEGLDVRLVEGGVGIDTGDEVLEGRAQFGVAGSAAVLRYLRGEPLRSLAVVFQHSPYVLMVRREAGILHPQQVVGKTLHMTLMPRTAEIQAMLLQEGVDLDRVTLVEEVETRPDFLDRSIDGYSGYLTNEPFLAGEAGMEFDLIRPISYGIDFYGDGLFTSEKEVEQHGERMQRFMRASMEGWDYAFAHPEETLELVARKYNTEGRSRAHLEFELAKMRELVLPDLMKLGTQNPQRWQRIADTYAALGMAPAGSAAGFAYDPEQEAYASQQQRQRLYAWFLGGAGAALLLLFFLLTFLRLLVRQRTGALEQEVAAHQATQEALRTTLSTYTTLFSSFPLGITITDPDGTIVETNAMAERILGVDRREHEQRTIDGAQWQLVRPDGSALPADEYASVIALRENRTVAGSLMGIARPGGSITWLDVSAAPIPLDELGVVIVYRDITAEHLAREEMARLQETLAHTEEMAHVGSWRWEVAGDAVTWSRELFRLFARDPALGAPSWAEHRALFEEEDFERLRQLVERAVETGADYGTELRAVRGDGEIRHCYARGYPESDAAGRVVRISGILQDITELVRAREDALILSQDQAAILDNIRTLLIYKDTENNILRVTESVARTTGLPRDRIEGRPSSEIYPEMAEQYYADDLEVISSGVPKLGIVEPLPVAGGETRWLMTDKIPTFDRQGRVNGIIVSAVDITELKQMEAQLIQSQKLEAIGVLAGGIAHDFNNILASVIGFAELALDDAPPDTELAEFVGEIHRAGLRASELVRQILAFARQSGDKVETIQPGLLVKEALGMLRATLPVTIDIVSEVRTEACVLGNASQIHQILMNLCTNAAHAMERDGGTLLVRLTEVEPAALELKRLALPPGKYLELLVSDTGTGIAPDILAKVTDPFFTTKEPDKGTGMGLAMVHGIVKAGGGALDIRSEPGRGTEVRVLLPVLAGTAPETPESGTLPQGTEHVLLVDDEPNIIESGRRTLERLGYRVTAFTSGEAALAAFAEDPDRFDLVLSDVTMPVLPGDRLAQKMLALRPDLPVILLTGYSDRISEEEAREMGVAELAFKPFSRAEMAHLLYRVLDPVRRAEKEASGSDNGSEDRAEHEQ